MPDPLTHSCPHYSYFKHLKTKILPTTTRMPLCCHPCVCRGLAGTSQGAPSAARFLLLCVCVWKSRLLLARNSRKSPQQLPGPLLLSRQRCKELDEDRRGTVLCLMNHPRADSHKAVGNLRGKEIQTLCVFTVLISCFLLVLDENTSQSTVGLMTMILDSPQQTWCILTQFATRLRFIPPKFHCPSVTGRMCHLAEALICLC